MRIYIYQILIYYLVIKMSPTLTEYPNIETFISNDDFRGNHNNAEGDNMAYVPEHIDIYNKRAKKIRNIIASRKNVHAEAYNTGIEAIVGKGGKLDDYSLLEDKGNQDKMIKSMVDLYIAKAREYLHVKSDHKFSDKHDEEMHNNELLQAYMGITKEELEKSIREHIEKHGGTSFTADTYMSMHDEGTKAIFQQLSKNATAHIKDEHIESIIRYTGAGKLLKEGEGTKMRKEEAIALLGIYDEGKHAVTERELREHGLAKYLRKKGKEEKEYEPQYSKAA